mgnify:CR=1 FL=1
MSILFPFQGLKTETEILNEDIIQNADNYMDNLQFLKHEIDKWKQSEKRQMMIDGERYYEGYQDMLTDDRTFIGEGGRAQVAHNLPNAKIIDNQYAKLVDQKTNYQVGKPFTIDTENDEYQKELEWILDKRFKRTLKDVTQGSMNMGLSWIYVYYNQRGELSFKRIPAYQIIPFYNEEDENELDYAIRVYTVTEYTGQSEEEVEKVELYTKEGIFYYVNTLTGLIVDVTKQPTSYINISTNDTSVGYNWEKIPLIPFRFNSKEIPLIQRVKSLQDAINKLISTFQNNMLEDSRNTILVIHNYDGEDLGEFRRNLATFGAVKVRSGGDARGGIDTLEVKVNSQNYESILKILKTALIENGRGFDAKDDRMSNNPNQMNIQSMYSDIELDANGIDTEYQAAFDELLWFIDTHIKNTTGHDYSKENVEIVFNHDMLNNESEIIDNIMKSEILSTETKLSMHPYVRDPKLEIQRKKDEEREYLNSMNPYQDGNE